MLTCVPTSPYLIATHLFVMWSPAMLSKPVCFPFTNLLCRGFLSHHALTYWKLTNTGRTKPSARAQSSVWSEMLKEKDWGKRKQKKMKNHTFWKASKWCWVFKFYGTINIWCILVPHHGWKKQIWPSTRV